MIWRHISINIATRRPNKNSNKFISSFVLNQLSRRTHQLQLESRTIDKCGEPIVSQVQNGHTFHNKPQRNHLQFECGGTAQTAESAQVSFEYSLRLKQHGDA